MNTSNNNVLKGDFDRRKREANAAQYIALKQFEKIKRRQFWTNAILSFSVVSGAIWGAYIFNIIGRAIYWTNLYLNPALH